MALRSLRERMIQTLAYECGGLCLSVPVYLLYSGHASGEGALLMVALSAAVLVWSPVHNTAFDWLDFRLSGRVASDRPQRLRMIHAASHEASTTLVTLPILIVMGGHGLAEALLVDIGLTLIYTVYAYAFHSLYDRLRPVATA